MATTIATVEHDGQLVLPAEVQKMLGILPGSNVEIVVHGQQIEITAKEAVRFDGEAARRAIQELRALLAGQPSLEDEYFRDRDRDKW